MHRSCFFITLVSLITACGSPADTSDGASSSGSEETSATPGTTSTETSGREQPTSTGVAETTTTGGATSTGGETSTGATSTGEGTSTGVVTTGDATTGDGTTGDETTGGATSPLVIAIVDAELYANCGMGEADPVWGQWYVDFDNTANPDDTAAVVVAAALSLADADPPVPEPILVDPVDSGPIAAGEYVSQKLEKLPGVAHGACDHCGEFYKLELEYLEGDVMHHVVEDVTISCQP